MTYTEECGRAIAIKESILLGRQLQRECPQIREKWYAIQFLNEIIDFYEIIPTYTRSMNIAKMAVVHALRGHPGGYGIGSYSGLITDQSELERLCKMHLSKAGTKTYDEKKGVHALTTEERKKIGEDVFKRRLGIYARSYEQVIADNIEAGKIGGIKSAESRGYATWTRLVPYRNELIPEIEYAHRLSNWKRYRNGKKVKTRLLAESLNKKFYRGLHTRNSRSLSTALAEFRKKLKK